MTQRIALTKMVFSMSASLLLTLGGLGVSTAQAEMLWALGFESESGVAVNDGQNATADGSSYVLDGTTELTTGNDPNARLVSNYGGYSGDVDNTVRYTAYGTSADSIPATIDPNGVAGNFCLDIQAANSTASRLGADCYIDTRVETGGIVSNSGNANDFLTMETYFNLQEDMVQGVPEEYYNQLTRIMMNQRRLNYNHSRISLGLGVKDDPEGEWDIPVLAIYYTNAAVDEYPHVLGTTEILQDEWYHVALTLDTEQVDVQGETVTQRNINVYLNGELEFSVLGLGEGTDTPDAVDTLYATGSSTRSFTVGACNAATNRTFIGSLDAVRITDQALIPTQFLCSSVPEPATIVIMVTGMMGLMFLRRRT